MIRRLLLVSFMTLSLFTTGSGAEAQTSPAITYPPAPQPNPDKLIAPPGERNTFPMRADGQPVYLNQDVTINMTDALNNYYFNPKLRGEEWGPFETYWIPE